MKSKLESKIFDLKEEKKSLQYQLAFWLQYISPAQIKVHRRRLRMINKQLTEFQALLDMRTRHASSVTALVAYAHAPKGKKL